MEDMNKIEEFLSQKEGTKKRMKVGRKAIYGFMVVLLAVSIAGAGLLTLYGEVQVTADVKQSVVISDDGATWDNYNEPIERNIGEVVHCTDYVYKSWIKNRACSEAEITIEDEWISHPGGPEGFDITHYVLGDKQTLNFYHKDSTTWEFIGEKIATLTFDTCSPDFDFRLEVEGAEPDTDYSLVYYMDQQDRMENWGGDPLHVIYTFTTDTDGNHIEDDGLLKVPTMPYSVDWNAGPEADYGDSNNGYDDYEHIRGAKLWIIPSSDVDGIRNNEVWNPETYLYEDDLILYIDCENVENPAWLPNVYPLFHTTTLQPERTYCWISCYHTVINIMPGNYAFNSKVIPELEE